MVVCLSFPDLRERGIRYTRQHLYRLIKANKFPRPIRLGENRLAWIESEIDQYLKQRIAERDAQPAS